MKKNRQLSKSEINRGLSLVVYEGLAGRTMEALTTGVFLVGIAIHLNASNFVIGLLGAIPFLTNLFQIPAIHIIEKYRNRRAFVAILSIIGRSFLLMVAIAPFVGSKDVALILVVIAMALRYSFGAMSSCAWNSWMRDLVPERMLGRFFGKRLFYTSGLATIAAISAGVFIDRWEINNPDNEIAAYSILYALGFVAGIISSVIISFIPHPPMPEPEVVEYEKHLGLKHLKAPFRHKNFRKLMMFLMSWNFAANLATPFLAVYMHRTLGYDMTFVIGITVMSQLVNVFAFRLWGKYSDLYSNKTVLSICGSLFIFSLFAWTFTSFPEKHALTLYMLVILHIFMGIATAGIKLSSNNIAMKLTPQREATSFLAVNTLLTSIAAGTAPLMGGLFADYFKTKTLSMEFHWQGIDGDVFINTLILRHWDFLFLFAFAIGLYSLGKLSDVVERGEVSKEIVIKELMLDTSRILRSISTVDGLRDLTTSPMAIMVNVAKKIKPKKRKAKW